MIINVDAARALMADSLGFHIIFAMLGVGLPLVILLIEHLGIVRKDKVILEHARRLSRATVILVVAGVASGTIISIQMSLMWGGLIHFGGPILGLAFGWEGYAFMIEAVFLAFYVTTWKKLRGWRHWLLGLPVAIGSLGSAVAITLGNAWMQNPGDLDVIDGVVATDNPLHALLSKTALFMMTHSIAGYYLATVLCVLGVYALYVLRFKPENKEKNAVREIMFRLSATAIFFLVVTALLGHFQTQYLAVSEPRKFAAIEMVDTTKQDAPYIIGGEWTKDGMVEGGIRIPYLLSLMTGNNIHTKVIGLQEFPEETWPMLIVSKLFEAKMVLIAIISVIPLIFTLLHWKRIKEKLRTLRYSKLALWLLIISGPLAIVIVELGWMVAEFGRQPFAVNGYLLTSGAYTAGNGIGAWGYVFPCLFIVLFAATSTALLLLFKREGKLRPIEDIK